MLNDKDIDNTCFISLMVATSYIEGVQQYIDMNESRNGSKATFIRGIKRIFEKEISNMENTDNIEVLYDQLRCGLFHDGMTRGQIVIDSKSDESIFFDEEEDVIEINHHMFLRKILEDFKAFIIKIKDINERSLRKNFDEKYILVKE